MGCSVTKQQYADQSNVKQIQEIDLQQKEYPTTPETNHASPRNQNIVIIKKLLANSTMNVDELVKSNCRKSLRTSLSRSKRQ